MTGGVTTSPQFHIKPGCTSNNTNVPDRPFVFVYECLHPHLRFLRCSSRPFEIVSRFRVSVNGSKVGLKKGLRLAEKPCFGDARHALEGRGG